MDRKDDKIRLFFCSKKSAVGGLLRTESNNFFFTSTLNRTYSEMVRGPVLSHE